MKKQEISEWKKRGKSSSFVCDVVSKRKSNYIMQELWLIETTTKCKEKFIINDVWLLCTVALAICGEWIK